MAHGHDVLHMMEGNQYASKEALIQVINQQFGTAERFDTCSVKGMTSDELVDFFEERGKFMPAQGTDFTVDSSKICHHDQK